MLESKAAILRGFHRLETWVQQEHHDFQQGQIKALHQACNNPIQHNKLGTG